jgi:hypothetical protein
MQSCLPTFTTFSETVEYGVPFSIQLDLQTFGLSDLGDPEDARVTYNFAQPGLAATPEPSSILLLMPGLAGVMSAAKSRARSRIA